MLITIKESIKLVNQKSVESRIRLIKSSVPYLYLNSIHMVPHCTDGAVRVHPRPDDLSRPSHGAVYSCLPAHAHHKGGRNSGGVCVNTIVLQSNLSYPGALGLGGARNSDMSIYQYK